MKPTQAQPEPSAFDEFSRAFGEWHSRMRELLESRAGIIGLPYYVITEARPRHKGPHPRTVGMDPRISERTMKAEQAYLEAM